MRSGFAEDQGWVCGGVTRDRNRRIGHAWCIANASLRSLLARSYGTIASDPASVTGSICEYLVILAERSEGRSRRRRKPGAEPLRKGIF